MVKHLKMEFPIHLLKYLVALSKDKTAQATLLKDEYVFSTYLAAILQGFNLDDEGNISALSKIIVNTIEDFDILASLELIAAPESIEQQESLTQIVGRLREQFNENVTTTYVKDFFFSASIYRAIKAEYRTLSSASSALEKIVTGLYDHLIAENRWATSIQINVDRIERVLDLTCAESNLLELGLLFSIDVRSMIFRDFLFGMTKNTSIYEYFYNIMLQSDLDDRHYKEVIAALSERSKPIALGIVPYSVKMKRLSQMSEFWVYALSNYVGSDEEFFSRFVEPIKERKKTFSGAIAKASYQDEKLLTAFLNKVTLHRLSDSKEFPVGLNVMLYGSSKLDKLGYVTEILKDLKAMQVRTRDARDRDIPAICYVAQRYVKSLNDSYVLVIDKAEQALTKQSNRPSWFIDMFSDPGLTEKPEDLDRDELLLIKNPVPSIWLTHSPASITAENIGRFLIHVELKGGSREDRRKEVQNIVGELGFGQELAQQLSKYYQLNVEQIKSAARTIEILDDRAEVNEKSLLHLIGNSQRALDREKMEELRDSVTKYDLNYLNLTGNMSPEKIIAALKKKGTGTMCLYGPPGTGKTQLVEYMAVQLDKPLIIKPASELLSMWLGDTEKNIAKMFEEAKAEGAMLLLDEADSFLRDRAMASKSWEVTQVNELLQRMERFPGIFVCATNLFQALDAAALRRFTFKLEFRPLTAQQRVKMLSTEAGINFEEMSELDRENLLTELAMIKYLTPGDFATVKRQANLLDETLTVQDWLDRLAIESKAKLAGLSRNTENHKNIIEPN